jgi:putative addiction module component (TIGR02574 family)
MNGSVETLTADAMQLPLDQRLTLAHRLLSSVEPTASAAVDSEWHAEIRERMARFDEGHASAIPAVEVFTELDRRLRR